MDRTTFFRQDGELPAGKIAAYFDGKSGWITSGQRSGILAGAQLKQVQSDLFRVYFRLLLSDRIEGRKVNAADADTLEITGDAGEAARVVVGADGLPKSVLYDSARLTGPPISIEEDYSDYREVAGVKVPYTVKITQGGQKFADVTVSDFRINTGLKTQDLGKRP